MTGKIPKRQAEELVVEVTTDFDKFYEQRAITPVQSSENILVMSQDGKGIVLRHDDLREATRKAAEREQHSLSTRLSTGEKRNRKRMATVATVYDIKPHYRKTADVITPRDKSTTESPPKAVPKAENKRVWASIEKSMESVTDGIVQEALRRDPNRERPWVMLVDGHRDQIIAPAPPCAREISASLHVKVIKRSFLRHGVEAPLILDFIHVLEYIWKAAWCFFDHSDKTKAKQAEQWVLERATWILDGDSGKVAAGIRNKMKHHPLSEKQKETIDKVAIYLTNHTKMLRYDLFMSKGYPIASGVIEGACRHLISDRFEITGARWSLKTAEGVLKLRAIRSSGDWEQYHEFHKKQEWMRNHCQRFHKSETSAMSWKK